MPLAKTSSEREDSTCGSMLMAKHAGSFVVVGMCRTAFWLINQELQVRLAMVITATLIKRRALLAQESLGSFLLWVCRHLVTGLTTQSAEPPHRWCRDSSFRRWRHGACRQRCGAGLCWNNTCI